MLQPNFDLNVTITNLSSAVFLSREIKRSRTEHLCDVGLKLYLHVFLWILSLSHDCLMNFCCKNIHHSYTKFANKTYRILKLKHEACGIRSVNSIKKDYEFISPAHSEVVENSLRACQIAKPTIHVFAGGEDIYIAFYQ